MRVSKLQKTWDELSSREQFVLLTVASTQVALAATAWIDLARRPDTQLRGPKKLWGLVIAINWVGPLAYFVYGVRRG